MKTNTIFRSALVFALLLIAFGFTACDDMFVNDGDSEGGINPRHGYFFLADNESMRLVMLDHNMIEMADWPFTQFTSETFVQGMTFDGVFLWLAVAGADDSLYQVDLASGTDLRVVRTLTAPPDGGGTVRDIAWDGESLWALNSGSSTYSTPPKLYQLDPITGGVSAEYQLPSLEPRALCYVGDNGDVYGYGATSGLYYMDKDEDKVYCFANDRASFLDGFDAPVGPRGENYVYPTGMFFDGEDFWTVNSSGPADYLFHLDYQGNELQRVDLPYGQPSAMVWTTRNLTQSLAPLILAVVPPTGGPSAHKTVSIQGSGFRDGDGLTADFGVGIVVDSVQFVSSSAINAYITIDPDADIGARDVTVTNPDGKQGVGEGMFSVVEDDPSTGFLWFTDYNAGVLYRYSINDAAIVADYDISDVAPDASPQGLAFDGENLWVSASGTDKIVVKFDTTGGTLSSLSSFDAPPDGGGTVRDMTFDGTDMWIANNGTASIYQVDTTDGSILSTISTPGDEVRGIVWANGSLYANDKDDDAVYVYDPVEDTWTEVFSAPLPPGGDTSNRYPTGMSWDGYNFWMCNSTGEFDYIFQISPDGTLLQSIAVPNRGTAQPTGVVFTQN